MRAIASKEINLPNTNYRIKYLGIKRILMNDNAGGVLGQNKKNVYSMVVRISFEQNKSAVTAFFMQNLMKY